MSEPTTKIKWIDSEAKAILEYDLVEGFLSMDEVKCTAEFAWSTYYRYLPQFKKVPFQQFEDMLKAHRNTIRFKWGRAFRDQDAYMQYRCNHPTQIRNQRGELNFDVSSARNMLREDVRNKFHEGITPTEFQRTRPEYGGFKTKKFKEHIYQEVRRQKFIFYLQQKRKKQDQILRCAGRSDNVIGRLYY